MIQAKNNIIVKIENPEPWGYAILNPVKGSFDLMSEEEHTLLLRIADNSQENNLVTNKVESKFTEYLLERGYLYQNSADEESDINEAVRDFHNEVAASQVQLLLVPTYGCNLSCTYCFQHGIDEAPQIISREVVDAFFRYIEENFYSGLQKPFVTLFGGEPLVNSPAQRQMIAYVVEKCIEADLELSIVTNGYALTEYIDILNSAKIKEIQITLDGSRDIHNGRRATANKKGTFDRIIEGISAAVENKMPINLRSVIDAENIADIVNLAEYLDSFGWLDLPDELFKTQLGRNYELFDCYAKPQHLMTRISLWSEYAALSKKHPILQKFHRPDFKGIRQLVDTGELPIASYDTCPACKTEWVFDLHGEIFGCTATCGRQEHSLGKFWPETDLDEGKIGRWKSRSVQTIEKCAGCKYDAVCGGGCGVMAANNNGGDILTPDCRPIQELYELGINHYIEEIEALAHEE